VCSIMVNGPTPPSPSGPPPGFSNWRRVGTVNGVPEWRRDAPGGSQFRVSPTAPPNTVSGVRADVVERRFPTDRVVSPGRRAETLERQIAGSTGLARESLIRQRAGLISRDPSFARAEEARMPTAEAVDVTQPTLAVSPLAPAETLRPTLTDVRTGLSFVQPPRERRPRDQPLDVTPEFLETPLGRRIRGLTIGRATLNKSEATKQKRDNNHSNYDNRHRRLEP